jgi:hypothetical protein
MYISATRATITTAAIATIATVEAATTTSASLPVSCLRNAGGERYEARTSRAA